MTWIADVVPEEVISSSIWGNEIRNRVWQTFANRTERNAHAQDGMMCICLDDRSTWEYRAGIGWFPFITQWRPWTIYMAWGPSSGPDWTTIITQSGVYAAMRRIGNRVEVEWEGQLNTQGYVTGLWLWFSMPQQPIHAGIAGTGKIYNGRTGLNYGPWPVFAGNFTLVGAHGSVNLPMYVMNVAGGSIYGRENVADITYGLSLNCSYRADIADDTPLALP